MFLARVTLLILMSGAAWSQVLSAPERPEEASPSGTQASAAETGTTGQQQENGKKKPSKVKKKLGDLVPGCANLIFYHGCRATEPDTEKEQAKLADATERCKQLTAALPPRFAPKEIPASSVPAGQSSSRAEPVSHPWCTPQDVLAADHDVDVGDYYLTQQNWRGAQMRYQSALERLPGEPVASLHLARVLEKLGNKAGALQHYESFLEWKPSGKDADEANAAITRLQKETAQK